MTDRWTDRLSEYLDGELSLPDRVALEVHLAECGACTAILDELRAVVAQARGLRDTPPAADLWPGIAARIAAPRFRRFALSFPQLIAASLVLLLAGGMGSRLLLPRSAATPTQAVVRPVPVAQPTGVLPAGFTDPRYDVAVADLQTLLAAHRDQLDPATVRTLQDNLALIDRAIADARVALAQDPASAFLNAHLAGAMQQKLGLLRNAVAIVTET